MKSKKGQSRAFTLAALGTIGLLLTLGGLIVTYSGEITGDIETDFRTAEGGWCQPGNPVNCTSAGTNISGNTLSGLTNYSDQFGTIGTIAGVAILLTVLISAFGGLLGGSGIRIK